MRDLATEFKTLAKSSNVKIEIEIGKDIPKIYSDPFQILQVVENLVFNAVRYMDFASDDKNKTRNEKKVVVKLFRRGNDVFCEVEDNGIGIPKDDQKFIFQKFFRAENVRQHQTNGSGLGLYISKSIIEKAGGKIGFESLEGKGTTFRFRLPILPSNGK